MRFLLWMPLVVSLSVAPAAAIPIHYSSLEALEASGIGPRIAHREQGEFFDGRYEDGSVAIGVVATLPEWFSSVYFNGTLYTYAYGVSELICSGGPCDDGYQFGGEAHLGGGFPQLVGATIGDRWGQIGDPTAGADAFWFYLQSAHAPADMLGRLIATSRISDGSFERRPHLVYTMGMDAYVPSPVPEPGTLVLVTTGLAGALIRRRYQQQKGSTPPGRSGSV